jgi:Tol biopolymer transport system component
MKPRFKIALALIALLVSQHLAQNSRTLESQFKAAQHRAEIDGDLPGAIEQFRKIAQTKGADRGLAAKAFLAMADSYRKLRDAEGLKIYEQIVREFGDQPEIAAAAQKQLASLRPSPSASTGVTREITFDGTRPIPRGLWGTVSSDGRYVLDTYLPTKLRDLITGEVRELSQELMDPIFSRDGKQIAYSGSRDDYATWELRLMKVTDNAASVKVLYTNRKVDYFQAIGWSPDDKEIAVVLYLDANTLQIGMFSIPEGKLRIVKPAMKHFDRPRTMSLSPDGKYLAFDLPVSAGNWRRDVHVLAMDSGIEQAVVTETTNDVVMGWLPDSKYLVFASERLPGEANLYAVPFADGKTQGNAKLVTANIGRVEPLGVTDSGALYVAVPRESQKVFSVVNFDFDTESFGSPAVAAEYVGSDPLWSADGKALIYSKVLQGLGGVRMPTLAVRSSDSPQAERELDPSFKELFLLGSLPGGDAFMALGAGFGVDTPRNLYRIDSRTAEPSSVPYSDRRDFSMKGLLAPDGTKIYYYRAGSRMLAVRDLASGQVDNLPIGGLTDFELSPDGQYLAVNQINSGMISLLQTAGGPPREFVRGHVMGWAPDSRSLFYTSDRDVWRVSLDGHAHKVTGFSTALSLTFMSDGTSGPAGFRANPNGKQLAFWPITTGASDRRVIVRVFENLLPALGRALSRPARP